MYSVPLLPGKLVVALHRCSSFCDD